MCLSAVYEIKDGNEELVCDYATAICLDGGSIKVTDITGEEYVIAGVLKSIDLVKNVIVISA